MLFLLLLSLISTTQSINILGVFMFPSFSHQAPFHAICKELSLRGHNVTILTTNPKNDRNLTNLREINLDFVYDIVTKESRQEAYSTTAGKQQLMRNMYTVLDSIALAELGSSQFQSFMKENNHFDLLLVQCIHPIFYAMSVKFRTPIIAISSMDIVSVFYDGAGNPSHPLLYPDFILNLPSAKTFFEKVEAVYVSLWNYFYYYYAVLPGNDEIVRKYIEGDAPRLEDLLKDVSMVMVNRNLVLHPPKPNVPAVMDISSLHLKAPKTLPLDLQKVLDAAPQGAIYVSFGSNVESIKLDQSLRNTIVQALTELPFQVLWKWEADHLPNKPENVLISKWFPQVEVLAHPNVKVFVTQGGHQSFEEALLAETPLVGIPFTLDQPRNVRRFEELAIGLKLDSTTLTADKLKSAIMEVAVNQSYKTNIKQSRRHLFDKAMTNMETVVWWIEYVKRHKGAKHLQSPSVHQSLMEYLLVDVVLLFIAFVIVAIFILYWITCKVVGTVLRYLAEGRNSRNLSNKETKSSNT